MGKAKEKPIDKQQGKAPKKPKLPGAPKAPEAARAPKPPRAPKVPKASKSAGGSSAPGEKGAGTGRTAVRRISPNSLMVKMIGAFVILIIMIFLVGTVSYSVAKNVVSQEVKASMTETVSAKGSYLELGLQQVDNQMLEIISMEECAAYYLNPKLDVSALTKEQTTAKGEVSSKILSLKSISDFVYHVYLISDVATGLTTTPVTLGLGTYEEFIASAEGQQIDASSDKWGYLGRHPFLEQAVYQEDDKFNSSDYAISMWRKVNMKTNMILVVDIDKSTVYNALAELDNGEGSYAAFVAPDGNETVYCGGGTQEEAPSFSQMEAYRQAIEAEAADGYREIRFQGRPYVFAYSRIGSTGAMLITLVPTSQFLGNTGSIQTITYLMVLVALVIAVAMCIFLSGTLSRGVTEITRPLDKVSRGDFTAQVTLKRKDEFGQIARSLSHMITSMKALIQEVQSVVWTVQQTSGQVGSSTQQLMESSDRILGAIDEIDRGVSLQAEDAQDCVVQINALSDQIRTVYEYTDEISRISEDANRTITDGMEVIGDLSEKSRATEEITGTIRQDILSLNNQTQSIGNIAEVIDEIASQTNLLSLNASIEAARAGDAGRGFAVVAEEIRKLADQSLNAAKQIGGIVQQIQAQTGQMVDAVHQAGVIVTSQNDSLEKTQDAFQKVNERVKMMSENLSRMTAGMARIEESKKGAVSAITNISAVSEQTSANSVQVDGIAKRQKEYVEELKITVEQLEEKARQMEAAVSQLKVE